MTSVLLCRYGVGRNSFCGIRKEGREQSFEPRTEIQSLALTFDESQRICRPLQYITQIRQPHEPESVTEIALSSKAVGYPTGIWHPTMLFRKSFIQQRVVYCTGKRNVDNATRVHMSDFGSPKPEFAPAKAVWVGRHFGPQRYVPLEFILVISFQTSAHLAVSMHLGLGPIRSFELQAAEPRMDSR